MMRDVPHIVEWNPYYMMVFILKEDNKNNKQQTLRLI
jgi:hypothetical protein